ncbi:HAD family hydrolase [Bernardetia sp. MNP-M8]|uniref:HAD family hydrolase n=1 Tax=Bernardetia sp. MNP-M8 TaxID=3127470 RepID=UPI0030D54D32
MDKEKIIAFFDFDGTITKRDTFVPFLVYQNGLLIFIFKLISLFFYIIAFYAKIISNEKLKERFIKKFIAGYSVQEINDLVERFIEQKIDSMCRKEALVCLEWHKANRHKIVIVSASPSYFIEKWATKLDFDSVSTELEIVNYNYTGKLKSKNCYGKEKVKRILERYDIKKYDEIYAYGDTKGDLPMLKLATKAYYKPFR